MNERQDFEIRPGRAIGSYFSITGRCNAEESPVNEIAANAMLYMDLLEVLAMCGYMDERTFENIRAHFTNIGCIMEDASAVALIWDVGDPTSLPDRYRRLAAAHNQIGAALEKIKAAIEGS